MSKPVEIPDDIERRAFKLAIEFRKSELEDGVQALALTNVIARAIMSAEKRGEERERAACELIAQDWTGGAEYIAAAIRKRGEG